VFRLFAAQGELQSGRKGVAPRKWIEVQSVEGYKVEQRTMSAVARHKVARRPPEEGGRRGKLRAEQGRKARKSVAERKNVKAEGA
jgi:hypothetical protein